MGTDLEEGYYERDNIKQTTKNITGITGNATGRIDKLIILQYSRIGLLYWKMHIAEARYGKGILIYMSCVVAQTVRDH